MTTALQLFSLRQARFVDQNGRLTAEAVRALNALLDRVGGATSISVTELAISDDEDSGLEEFRHESTKVSEGLQMQPLPAFEPYSDPLHPIAQQHSEVQALQTEMSGLREQVAVLMQQINDLQQGTIYDGAS